MQATTFLASGVDDTLDVVSRLHAARTDADAGLFEAAAHFADLHSGESLPRSRTVLAGMERAVRVGGEGTPRVAEFAYAELGARMQMGTWSARRYVADALDVRHRLPLIWGRVQAREARIGNARVVATRTRHLSMQAAARVDAAMVEFVDGSLPWGRFLTRLEGRVVAADPEVAAAREQEAVRDQFARRTRSSESAMAGFYVWSTVGVVARLDATVAFLADALQTWGDGDPEDLRRVKAVALLANPVRAVELLAATAAARTRSHATTAHAHRDPAAPGAPGAPFEQDDDAVLPDEPLPGTGGRAASGPDPDTDPRPEPKLEVGPLERVDAFARSVGFTPTRLPAWLAAAIAATRGEPATPTSESPSPEPPEPLSERSEPLEPSESLQHSQAPPTSGFMFDWARLLPSLTLHLHMSATDLEAGEGGVVRWEREGPITHQFLHEHLRPMHRYVIQPVIDLAHMAPADAYEIPDRLRRAVHLRTPADVFPFSSNTTGRVDIDHTDPYHPANGSKAERYWSTRIGNLGPLGRFGHRIKTHGRWTLRQPFEGIYLWRDPHGQVYLVDHTGTHQITPPGHKAGTARPFDPDVDVHLTDTVIELT